MEREIEMGSVQRPEPTITVRCDGAHRERKAVIQVLYMLSYQLQRFGSEQNLAVD